MNENPVYLRARTVTTIRLIRDFVLGMHGVFPFAYVTDFYMIMNLMNTSPWLWQCHCIFFMDCMLGLYIGIRMEDSSFMITESSVFSLRLFIKSISLLR